MVIYGEYMVNNDLWVSINGGSPSHHLFLDGNFPYGLIQLWEYPHLWKLPYGKTIVYDKNTLMHMSRTGDIRSWDHEPDQKVLRPWN